MYCELNVSGDLAAGHNAKATWRAINAHGAPFDLCDDCAKAYMKNNPQWEQRGVRLVRLAQIDPPLLPVRP